MSYDPEKIEELVAAARAWYGTRVVAATFRLERAVEALTPKRHTFGGVVFEETGEVRVPACDEYWLESDDMQAAHPSGHALSGFLRRVKFGGTHGYLRPILRPVAIKGE